MLLLFERNLGKDLSPSNQRKKTPFSKHLQKKKAQQTNISLDLI